MHWTALGLGGFKALDVRYFGGSTSLVVCGFIETGDYATRVIDMVVLMSTV